MGRIDSAPQPTAVEFPLPWGPVVRGVQWGWGSDVALFLHEPGADLDAWGPLPSRLAEALGLTSVALDLPGHGLSDDPWELHRAGELVRFLVETVTATSDPDASTEGGGKASGTDRSPGRRFVIAADSIASETLTQAGRLRLAGLVAVSPIDPASAASEPREAMPSTPTALGGRSRKERDATPKLLIAGSLSGSDLATARRIASTSAGWTAVTSIPATERGTALLATPWKTRISEGITGFLRECLHPRPGGHPVSRVRPRLPD